MGEVLDRMFVLMYFARKARPFQSEQKYSSSFEPA